MRFLPFEWRVDFYQSLCDMKHRRFCVRRRQTAALLFEKKKHNSNWLDSVTAILERLQESSLKIRYALNFLFTYAWRTSDSRANPSPQGYELQRQGTELNVLP